MQRLSSRRRVRTVNGYVARDGSRCAVEVTLTDVVGECCVACVELHYGPFPFLSGQTSAPCWQGQKCRPFLMYSWVNLQKQVEPRRISGSPSPERKCDRTDKPRTDRLQREGSDSPFARTLPWVACSPPLPSPTKTTVFVYLKLELCVKKEANIWPAV